MIDYAFIGARLKEARIRKNMTQEQLAAMTDVGSTHISHIETGMTIPSTKLLAQIKHLQSLVFAHAFGHKKRAPIHSRCGANRRSMYITIFNFICYNCMVLKTSAFFD